MQRLIWSRKNYSHGKSPRRVPRASRSALTGTPFPLLLFLYWGAAEPPAEGIRRDDSRGARGEACGVGGSSISGSRGPKQALFANLRLLRNQQARGQSPETRIGQRLIAPFVAHGSGCCIAGNLGLGASPKVIPL
jgi:hypothetical protein